MRPILSLLIIPLISILIGTAQPLQQQKGTSSIKGRITIENKPAMGVAVLLQREENRSPNIPLDKATTNAEGYYMFTGVSAGKYTIVPNTPTFVMQGSKSLWRSNTDIIVGNNEAIEGMNFSLERGGVITGRVTDTNGQPIIEASINIQRVADNGRGSSSRGGYCRTDDRGIYRIYGLPAGKYLVSTESRGYGSAGKRYPVTFHPDATEEVRAAVIDLTAGGEVSNADITVGSIGSTFKASGRVIYEDSGKPIPNIFIKVHRLEGKGQSSYSSPFNRSDQDGNFTINGLNEGRYAITAFMSIMKSETDKNIYSDPTVFEVRGSNVSDLEIKVLPGAIITGTIVVEGTNDRSVLDQLAKLSVNAFKQVPREKRLEPSTSGDFAYSEIKPDSSFKLEGLSPGKYRLSLSGVRNENKFSLLRVEHFGADKTDGVDVAVGQPVNGLRVVVAYGSATLRGQVTVVGGTLPENARMFGTLYKVKDGENSYYKPLNPDANGRFIVDGIVSGNYEVRVRISGIRKVFKQQVNINGGETEIKVVADLSDISKEGANEE
jgi:hypothetical protein